ncbi:MAG: VWA domain-containing protein, partial [Rubrivivax sp.]|nr:VWA domain-containing protein [Pyrinomonadaceae bacterium]
MTKRAALFPVLIFALLISAFGQSQQSLPAQSQPTPTPQEEEDDVVRITTNLVQVDAVVTDKDGRQVTNLRAEDFELLENGRPRQVTNFSYITTAPSTDAASSPAPAPASKRARGIPPVPPARLRPGQVQRTIALVVDDLMMSAESIHYARGALRKYVDEQIQPGDLVAIIRTTAGIGALQQFTADRQQLYAAIERVRWTPRSVGGQSAFPPVGALDQELGPGESGSGVPGTLPEGVDSARSGLKELSEYRQEQFVVGTLGALNYVVQGLREMPGRKAVILFSDGLSLSDPRGNTPRYTGILGRLIDLANRASVVFYTIDARGLQPVGPTAADDTAGSPAGTGRPGGIPTHQIGQRLLGARSGALFDSQGGLALLARSTGGTSLINQNDLNKGIRRALDDMRGYYLIGYRPEDSAFDPSTGSVRFNSLTARVKNRPDLRVRTRSGYIGIVEAAGRPQPRSRADQLMAALVSPFGAGGINLRLTSLFIDTPGGGSAMHSMLLIDPRTLTFKQGADGQHETAMDIIAVTFGADGRVVDQLNRIDTIRVRPESFESFLKQGMVYDLNVPIKRPGAYQLRIAVRDAATERVGSASQYVEVPDLGRKRLTLSGLVVASPPAQPATPATGATAGAVPTTGDQQTDPATRRFRRGTFLDYGF